MTLTPTSHLWSIKYISTYCTLTSTLNNVYVLYSMYMLVSSFISTVCPGVYSTSSMYVCVTYY